MSKYIKSHSNYVLKSRHQAIKDGTVFERNITTIGGINDFPNGQMPIYKSGNFLVTVRGGGLHTNQYNLDKWEENQTSGTVWNLESISGMTSSKEEDNDTKIVLKQDYYDLSDFAYYGSLTELFRTSVTDILDRFPGELYCTESNAYYTESSYEDGERIDKSVTLGGKNCVYIDNPFAIDLHSKEKPIDGKELKFFADEGYKNYEIISSGDITGTSITSWSAITESDKTNVKGKNVSIITLNDNFVISGFVGDNCEMVYLTDENNIGCHIRPKQEFLDEFYNGCSNFQRLLMNKDTNYTATFSVIRENDYGYYRELMPFKFPTSVGDYNIDVESYGFNDYTRQMVEIGEYYDEKFSDNLWRSMTHEAIKNFDWSYTREFQEGDEEEYVFGGQRIQKALRIFAREFDEILSYINNIKNINRVTYDERSNIPDYFLTDVVENSGWDVKLVYPYSLTEYYYDNSGNKVLSTEYTDGNNNNCIGQLYNKEKIGNTTYDIIREFSQVTNGSVKPYTSDMLGDNMKYGYFLACRKCVTGDSSITTGDTTPTSKTYVYKYNTENSSVWYDECVGILKNRIKPYTNETDWTPLECNNEFLRRLKINSPYIWRNKGTIDGIEMILGMFGLKSKRWSTKKNGDNAPYDFDVTEYTSFAHRIEETWDVVHQDYRINWLNSTKLIAYDNRFISNYNRYGYESTQIPYQGLPISYRDEYEKSNAYIGNEVSLAEQIERTSGGTYTGATSGSAFSREDGTLVIRRYLYPHFNNTEQLDGNMYYQMDGGWLSKIITSGDTNKYNFQYDKDNNINFTNYTESAETLYKETVRNIRRVDNIGELLTMPLDQLHNGMICNVSRIEKNTAIIDGVLYPIEREYSGNNDSEYIIVEYITFTKYDGFVKVGENKYFDTTMIVYDKYGSGVTYDISDKPNGYSISAYIINDNFKCQEDVDGNYSINTFIKLDNLWNTQEEVYTNYFVLDDVNYSSEIASGTTSGWKRLKPTDSEYIKVNTIINYYKGNNPHNGNMVYDNGHEYFTYFKRLFKYAIDNDLFDSRCFEDYNMTLDDEIVNYGFNGLVNNNESILNYDSFLSADTKIHYFGNYKTIDNTNAISNVWIYGEDTDRIDGFKHIYSAETRSEDLINGYILNASSTTSGWIESYNPYSGHQEANVDEVTNQIMNNKRLCITFNLHNAWYTQKGQEEMKYIDDVVMNYLTQMIPSTAILQIKYNSKVSEL